MKRSFLLTLLAPLLAAGSLHAAADYLLEIDGIKGESSDDRHSQAIEIQSFSWGSTNTAASAGGGGGGAGKVVFQDMHFTAKVSKAGPQLLFAGASASHYPRVILTMRKAGGAAGEYQEYYHIQLEDVLITSYSISGSPAAVGDIVPTDQFSLNFNKVTMSYTGLDGTVTTGTAVRTPITPQ